MPSSRTSSPAPSKELVQKAAKELERRYYLRNLYEFNNEVLGYADMAESPHRLMCSTASDRTRRFKMHQWPRGHFKSSMITVGYVVQRICENPDIRVLITNAVLSNAQSFLREIKGHFERNGRLRSLYGDHVGTRWNEDTIISAKRTRNLKEPTVQVAGVGQGLASQHYDLIITDDPVNELTVTTPEQLQKTIGWFQMAYSLLEPDGELIDIGTRYHQGDLHGWIEREMGDDFDIQVHSVYVDDDPLKGTIFPGRFNGEVIEGIRKAQGSYKFSCQYRNKPVNEENAKFRVSDFRYYAEKDTERMTLYTTMTVDRAYSLSKAADFTGITVVSKDMDGNRYVRYAKRHKQKEGEITKAIFDLREYYKVDRVGIEQKAFKDTMRPILDDEMRRTSQFFTVVELKAKAAKYARIESLVPYFESHSVWFIKDEMVDLEDELTNFPTAAHDDLADALAYHETEEMEGYAFNQASIIGYEEGLGGAQIPVYDF